MSEGQHIPRCVLGPGLGCTRVAGTDWGSQLMNEKSMAQVLGFEVPREVRYQFLVVAVHFSLYFNKRGLHLPFSQNLKIVEVERDLCRSTGSTSVPPRAVCPDHIWTGFGCFQV